MRCPIYVISLDRSQDRRERILARLADLGLSAEIFPAIEGAELAPENADYAGRIRRLCFGKDLSAGEIGCAHSHRGVYKRMVEAGTDVALVLEDDAIVTDELPYAVTALLTGPRDWDLVRFLAEQKVEDKSRLLRRVGQGQWCLSRPYGTPGGAYGYLLSANAARRLLEEAQRFWVPIDTLHGQVWRHGLRVRHLSPSPVLPDHTVESTIGASRFVKQSHLNGWERIVHPLARAAFKVFDAATKQASFRWPAMFER
jgi:glycosyl transferase family 25